MTAERMMQADAESLYDAWTSKFDCWFAEPGDLIMKPEVDVPFFFRTRRDWGSHPHYGRFTELERNKVVELTWLSGEAGTEGRETVVRVELTPMENGTKLELTHSGLQDPERSEAHRSAWLEGLEILDAALTKQK